MTIHIYTINAATGKRTLLRAMRVTGGSLNSPYILAYPRCQCPRCKERGKTP